MRSLSVECFFRQKDQARIRGFRFSGAGIDLLTPAAGRANQTKRHDQADIGFQLEFTTILSPAVPTQPQPELRVRDSLAGHGSGRNSLSDPAGRTRTDRPGRHLES